ncbi:MAG: tRNA epoxyqueuosine(34) reductase QueG [Verrucomicrobiota bacterium]
MNDSRSTRRDVKEALRQRARALGFEECRFATAGPAPHADAFRKWIADGCHGEMAWLAKRVERRTNPCEVLEGARSVIVLAVNYFQEDPPSSVPDGMARGMVARYAWGNDYHDLIEAKLREFSLALEDLGERHRYYVDTGPVLERDFASASGLGWNGKSTVQIHPELGTWFFLATVLTTLEVEPDPPMNDHCGKCTRCVEACPTTAITRDRRVDARRCLSYLTIEHRGPIPEAFRRPMGDRIFGCDDCLAVCPWNRFARASREATFAARPFVADWSLRDLLGLDVEGFRELFRKSPIKRTKRRGFLRNVCVALGNVGNEDDLPALRKAAAVEEELIAEHARWAIGEIEERRNAAAVNETSE